MNKRQLYIFISILSMAGYLWVLLNMAGPMAQMPDLCLFKKITGFPCPSCGSTHGVISLLQLHPWEAFMFNPLSFIISAGLLALPSWVLYDYISGRSTFYGFYTACEYFIRKRAVSATLILLLTANWLWTIYKYTA